MTPESFKSTSGNIAAFRVSGCVGEAGVTRVSWDRTPSQADVDECNAFYAANNPQLRELESAMIDDPVAAANAESEYLAKEFARQNRN